MAARPRRRVESVLRQVPERRKTAPTAFQVGTYSVVRSYLKAVEATNSDDPKTVIAKMRDMQVDDAFTANGNLRPDGRMVHDVIVVQIKSPAESKGEWDLLKLVATIPGDKASVRCRTAPAPRLRTERSSLQAARPRRRSR